MDCKDSHYVDCQIGETLLKRVVRYQVMTVATEGNVAPVSLPEPQPINNSQDQKLVEQLAEAMKVIGDKLDQDTEFNDMIDGLAKECDKSIFSKLVEKVFKDKQIKLGGILVLFYSVGKLSAKMVLARLPRIVSDILAVSLDYFRKNLLGWICGMGGWVVILESVQSIVLSINHFREGSDLTRRIALGHAIPDTHARTGSLLRSLL